MTRSVIQSRNERLPTLRTLYSPPTVSETGNMSIGVGARAARPADAERTRFLPVLLRGLLWLLLGGWVGSWLLFALIVAPTAFRVLPSANAAGALVAPVLDALHLYGAAAGLILAALAFALRRGPLRVALPIAMTAACLYTQFGVSAELAEIRDIVFGPEGSEQLAGRFNHLHRLSVAIFSTVLIAALVLVALHAVSDARGVSVAKDESSR
jgi:hypothetical protein